MGEYGIIEIKREWMLTIIRDSLQKVTVPGRSTDQDSD